MLPMFAELAVTNWCDFPVSPDILQKWIIIGIKQVAILGGVKEVHESFNDEDKGSTVDAEDKITDHTGNDSSGSKRGKNARKVEDDTSSNNENILDSDDGID
ncbi:hypothetical protein DAPPUDRAFT_265942 [Daphnia pulex]|uniref:Uncharacterized protein n=1 Tax=Daphnia pulex TaxID=6669 RepID=E9HU93_DAPPU|nr:hypothetical protein DAPPUDRAFT_265942 [Daphnia pulex]|eukprot:EFX64688.1 hypothetical protein DAPPUDRAFT_265942 [Daphnia pulex]